MTMHYLRIARQLCCFTAFLVLASCGKSESDNKPLPTRFSPPTAATESPETVEVSTPVLPSPGPTDSIEVSPTQDKTPEHPPTSQPDVPPVPITETPASLPTPHQNPSDREDSLFQLDSGLTALEVFDALQPQVEDLIGDARWVMLSGSPQLGWQVGFYDAASKTAISFYVQIDGLVILSPDNPPELMLGNSEIPLERSEITIDSSEAGEIAAENGLEVAVSPPVFFLSIGPNDRPLWKVTDLGSGKTVEIDAATGRIA
jgi:hypothetical protein